MRPFPPRLPLLAYGLILEPPRPSTRLVAVPGADQVRALTAPQTDWQRARRVAHAVSAEHAVHVDLGMDLGTTSDTWYLPAAAAARGAGDDIPLSVETVRMAMERIDAEIYSAFEVPAPLLDRPVSSVGTMLRWLVSFVGRPATVDELVADNVSEELVELAREGKRPEFTELAGCVMPVDTIDECYRGVRQRLRLPVLEEP